MELLSLPSFFSPRPHRAPRLLTPSADSIRRPTLHTSADSPFPKNPLQSLHNSSNPLAKKLWLSGKLSPPPPPPPPPETLNPQPQAPDSPPSSNSPCPATNLEFQQKGKVFVGNLPLWVKKNEVAEFFRQFGPIKNVILIKGHDDPERNVGYCFIIYGGPTAAEGAARAVEFDGVEFRGRVLTVRLDDGRRLRVRAEERAQWALGKAEGRAFRSSWHEERDAACQRFRKVLDTQPENWQAVISAFERIPKV